MIETYEQISKQVKAIQFFDDIETRKDAEEFLGKSFSGYREGTQYTKLIVRNFVIECDTIDTEFMVYPGDFLIKTEDGVFKRFTQNDFRNKYIKIWD